MSRYCTWVLVTLLLSCIAVFASADGTQCPENSANDLAVLQYALTLEHLESTFYDTYNKKYSASDFAAAGFDSTVYSYFQLIQAHEDAHVVALSEVIKTRGGTPVPACTYTFPVDSVASYVATARVLENTGVSAYDGGVNGISDPELQQTAATIATIEARHAGYLNSLEGLSSFPNITDPTLTPAEVVSMITGFVEACSYHWNDSSALPTVRPHGATFVASQNPPPAASQTLAPGTYTEEQASNDLKALNYALTLEHLEATFYTQGKNAFTRDDFTSAGFNSSVYDNFALITAHEVAHVTALQGVINSRSGTPVPACTYNFSFSSVKVFVATAQLLENTGVSAYDGAINTIADTGVQMVAATIATVEARHAQYLNRLNEASPFPNATDKPVAPKDIIAAASAFIVSCPGGGDLPLPTVAPNSLTPCDGASCTTPASGTTTSTTTGSSPSTGSSSTPPATSATGGASNPSTASTAGQAFNSTTSESTGSASEFNATESTGAASGFNVTESTGMTQNANSSTTSTGEASGFNSTTTGGMTVVGGMSSTGAKDNTTMVSGGYTTTSSTAPVTSTSSSASIVSASEAGVNSASATSINGFLTLLLAMVAIASLTHQI